MKLVFLLNLIIKTPKKSSGQICPAPQIQLSRIYSPIQLGLIICLTYMYEQQYMLQPPIKYSICFSSVCIKNYLIPLLNMFFTTVSQIPRFLTKMILLRLSLDISKDQCSPCMATQVVPWRANTCIHLKLHLVTAGDGCAELLLSYA